MTEQLSSEALAAWKAQKRLEIGTLAEDCGALFTESFMPFEVQIEYVTPCTSTICRDMHGIFVKQVIKEGI